MNEVLLAKYSGQVPSDMNRGTLEIARTWFDQGMNQDDTKVMVSANLLLIDMQR